MKYLVSIVSLLIFAIPAMAQISGAGQLGCTAAPVTGTGWTSGTSVNTTQVLANNIAGSEILVTLDQGTTLTAGAISFLGNPGDGTFVTLAAWQVTDPTSATQATISIPYSLVASTNKQFLLQTSGYYQIEMKLTTAITGTGTITPYTTIICGASSEVVQATGANLNASVTFPSAQAVTQSGTWNIGTITTIPSIPTGANVIGAVTQSGTWNVGTITTLPALPTGSNTIGAVTQSAGPWTDNITQVDGTSLGAPSNYGTSPGAVAVIGVNADVTNTVTVSGTVAATQSGTWNIGTITTLPSIPTGSNTIGAVTGSGVFEVGPTTAANTATNAFFDEITDGTNAMGAMANYGTSPGAVKAINANVYVTNTPAVSQSGTWNIGTITTLPSIPTGSNTIGAVTASGVFEVGPTTAANTATNAFFDEITDGTNAMGAMSNYGTAPGAVKALNANANVTNTVAVNQTQVAGSTVVADPCQVNARSSANISLTAGGQIITGTSGKQTYICSMDLVSATAQNIALVEGTGTTCATSITGMAGGSTAATGWNFGANGGLVKGTGNNWVFKTATAADNVCLLLSSTGQTSGSVQYVQQ